MKSKLSASKGMSLIEVMVTTAVASIIMVAIGNSLISLYQHQSTVTAKDEGNEFAADFSRLLSQNDVCTSMLNGITLSASGAPIEITIPDLITANKQKALTDPAADDLQAGTDIYNGLRTLSLTIENSSLPDQETEIDLTPNDADTTLTTVVRRVAEIELRLGIVKADNVQELKPRRYQVPVMALQSNDRIHSCATELQVTDACSTIGSAYDPTTGSCVPSTNCFMKGAYTTVNCKSSDGVLTGCPDPVLNKITSGQNCPGAGMATESGRNSFQIAEDCGKKCTRYYDVEIIYYICLECS